LILDTKKDMKKQWQLFLTAVMFYTRIPVPKSMEHSDEILNKSTKYFPLMGWIVGGFGALVFYLSLFIFPFTISIVLSMVATILLTGAFHEDGFADTCDAFGGGWTKSKILEIMKDSRIGTYGTVGLILILFVKFLCLSSISIKEIPYVLFASHALSRFSATGMIFYSRYVRDDAQSKSKPVGQNLSVSDFIIAFVFGVTPLLLLSYITSYWFLILILTVIPVIFFLKRYFEKWIGGFTGDTLGTTQQVSEIVIYLTFIAIARFV